MKKIPVIIDTDGGIDDALAILMALNSPEIEIKAITVVAGNKDLRKAALNIKRVVEIADPVVVPPIVMGASAPLKRVLVESGEVHGEDGLGNLAQYSDPNGERVYPDMDLSGIAENAVDVLIEEVDKNANELIIVTIGPMTNVATAIRKAPETMKKVKKIISMGGAFRVPGNTTAAAEFNIYVDPEAAQEVIEHGIPVLFAGLDVTMQTGITRDQVLEKLKQCPGKQSQFIADCSEFYMRFHQEESGYYGCYVHDALAVALSFQPNLVETENLLVNVETKGDLTRGMTLADYRSFVDYNVTPATAEVCAELDSSAFLKLLSDRLWP